MSLIAIMRYYRAQTNRRFNELNERLVEEHRQRKLLSNGLFSYWKRVTGKFLWICMVGSQTLVSP